MFESSIRQIELILSRETNKFTVYIERENRVTNPVTGQETILPPWRTSINSYNPDLVQQLTRDGAVLSPEALVMVEEVLRPILELIN